MVLQIEMFSTSRRTLITNKCVIFYFYSQGFEDCLVFDEIMDQLNENIGKTETQENSSSQYFWDERNLLVKL